MVTVVTKPALFKDMENDALPPRKEDLLGEPSLREQTLKFSAESHTSIFK